MSNKKGSPTNLDKVIGYNVRCARIKQGLSQEQIAETIGVSFQQVQKYERGINRIAASRLADLSVTLGVPIDYFFPEEYRSCASQYIRDLENKLESVGVRLDKISSFAAEAKQITGA